MSFDFAGSVLTVTQIRNNMRLKRNFSILSNYKASFLLLIFIIYIFIGITNVYADDYVIGGGDTLKISVYDHEDLGSKVRVSAQGDIILPLIGSIKIGGLNIDKATQKIANMYASGYIVNPQVSIFVEEYRSQKVTILGQVKKPGVHELRESTTLLELISKAEGLTPEAGESAILTRKKNGSEENTKINLKDLTETGDSKLNFNIQDGDTIFISKVELVYVTGEVGHPNAYSYEKDLTVLKAIAKAKGLSPKASTRSIKIIRKEGDKEVSMDDVKLDDLVLPGDVIVVPESFF